MTIEQVLMHSLKTTGGLTRGRGISPSIIATCRIVDARETFSGVASTTSEQHVDLRESRQRRDLADMTTLKRLADHTQPI